MSLDFWINAAVLAGIYGIFTLGLQLNAGTTGLLNFGLTGFMAIGAYGVGILVVDFGLSLLLALLISLALATAAGVLLGLSTLRLRADHFAIATVAVAEIIRYTLQNAEFAGGNQGIIGFDAEWRAASGWLLETLTPLGLHSYMQLPLLLGVWTTFLLLIACMEALRRTPWARVLRAMRDDEDATAALGKDVSSYRAQSLGIAAAFAALAGFFVALNVTYLYPTIFDPTVTFFGYAILLLGGLGSYAGVALGSILFWVLLEGTRLLDTSLSAGQQASTRFIIVGLLLILVSRLRPQGLLGERG